MSIPAYAVVNDLPAPVTTGSTIQSFTDVNGEVWVAKNGVNSGQWRKARDVLHIRAYRAAAFTLTTTPVQLNWDTASRDTYGLLSSGSFLLPVAGSYRIFHQVTVTFTAANQYGATQVRTAAGANIVSRTNLYAPVAGNMYVNGQDEYFLGAGDTVSSWSYASASLAGYAGSLDTYVIFDYMGAG